MVFTTFLCYQECSKALGSQVSTQGNGFISPVGLQGAHEYLILLRCSSETIAII
ncbi:hypothetical protein LCGC14_1825860, partial [marine sediment metagenome]